MGPHWLVYPGQSGSPGPPLKHNEPCLSPQGTLSQPLEEFSAVTGRGILHVHWCTCSRQSRQHTAIRQGWPSLGCVTTSLTAHVALLITEDLYSFGTCIQECHVSCPKAAAVADKCRLYWAASCHGGCCSLVLGKNGPPCMQVPTIYQYAYSRCVAWSD